MFGMGGKVTVLASVTIPSGLTTIGKIIVNDLLEMNPFSNELKDID